jgi:6-phosphofructokinase
MKYGACIVGQSGGPTCVINASIEGIFESALKSPAVTEVYGALNGIDGILSGDIIDIKREDSKELSYLKTTPSAALGSVRFKMKDFREDDTVYKQLKDIFEKLDIRFFFYCGGNDSMDTCHKIGEYFLSVGYDCSVIGVPKTIDNDLVETDHAPGFGSAAKMIATTMAELYQDISCYKVGRVTIVEIMGRDAGWLTASSCLASINGYGPDLIYLPEVPFEIEDYLTDVKRIYEQKKHVFIAVSEGIRDKDGKYLLKVHPYNKNDGFGHMQLGGVGMILADITNRRLGYSVRSIELNLPQRCASHVASATDITEAYNCGAFALNEALKGNTDVMVAMKRENGFYHIDYQMVPLKKVANLVKHVPLEWINDDHNGIKQGFIDYALPLIQGEEPMPYENGMPRFAKLKKIKINEKEKK